jgi:hypothetical protein
MSVSFKSRGSAPNPGCLIVSRISRAGRRYEEDPEPEEPVLDDPVDVDPLDDVPLSAADVELESLVPPLEEEPLFLPPSVDDFLA